MALSTVRFFKVTALPAELQANSFYYVENGAYAESYLTDDAGVAKKIGNTEMIQAITQHVDAGFFS
jgi:hypothetical protein